MFEHHPRLERGVENRRGDSSQKSSHHQNIEIREVLGDARPSIQYSVDETVGLPSTKTFSLATSCVLRHLAPIFDIVYNSSRA